MADNQQMPDISDYIPYMEDAVEDVVNRRNREIGNRARAAVAAKTLDSQVSAPGVEDALQKQLDQTKRELHEMKKQTEAQKKIAKTLEKEALDRARDDKKYFWLGALVSLVTSLLVTYGSKLILALQRLFL